MKPVVLVTAIGTVTATAIVTELKKTNEYYLIGADINPENQIATSLDVDEYHVFPYASNDDYLDFVLDFCKQHKVDYYYAVLDIEVVKISRARDKFAEIGTKLCMAIMSTAVPAILRTALMSGSETMFQRSILKHISHMMKSKIFRYLSSL